MTFSVYSKGNSVGTSVSGGASFRADLDDDHSFQFSIISSSITRNRLNKVSLLRGGRVRFLGHSKPVLLRQKQRRAGIMLLRVMEALSIQSKARMRRGKMRISPSIHISATPGQEPIFINN